MPDAARGLERRALTPALLVAATVVSYAIGYVLGLPLLVPILNAAPAFPAMLASLRRGDVPGGIARMLAWAAALAVCATVVSYTHPEYSGRLFLNGDRYRREMFEWILTGAGTEGRPREFLPVHALHAGIFVALSLLTGSLLSLPMGAVLMNYMGHFVGAFAAASARPVATMFLAWHPWSVVRVASFVVLGVVLAGPVLSRIAGFPFRLAEHRRLLQLAGAGLVLDVVLKAALAPAWRELLRGLAGW
jgi:hypothetical protein